MRAAGAVVILAPFYRRETDSDKLCDKIPSKWSWTLSHAQGTLPKLGPANSKSTFFPLSQALGFFARVTGVAGTVPPGSV